MTDAIKLKVLPQFPARLIGRAGIDVTKDNGDYYLDLDYTDFPVVGSVPSGTTYALVFDPATGKYVQVPISLLGGGGGASVLVSDAPPVGAADNSLWWESDTGNLYIRYHDIDGVQWVPATLGGGAAPARTVLTADRNLFVNAATGSDANTGLTPGTAFATLQKAMDAIAASDNGIFNNVVTVANGTYAQLILKTYLGSGNVTFNGDTVTPGNVIISSANIAVFAAAVVGGNFIFNGFRLQSSGAQDVNLGSYTIVTFSNCEWAGTSSNYRIYCSSFGRLQLQGAHKVLTGGAGLFLVEIGGFLYLNGAAFTFGASVTFGVTAVARSTGMLSAFTTTFALGGFVVTGTRYQVVTNAVILDTGNTSLFPGTVAGTTATGGQYT